MAAPVLIAARRALAGRGWLVVSVTLGTALLAGALLSPDRQQSLQEHQASGLMRDLPAAQVVAAQIEAGTQRWQLSRTGAGWAIDPPPARAQGDLSERVEMALRLLRNAAPERNFDAVSPEFGLTPPALQVRLFTSTAPAATPAFEAAFGGLNPIGLARYARLGPAGAVQTVLLPSYVADAWDGVVSRP